MDEAVSVYRRLRDHSRADTFTAISARANEETGGERRRI